MKLSATSRAPISLEFETIPVIEAGGPNKWSNWSIWKTKKIFVSQNAIFSSLIKYFNALFFFNLLDENQDRKDNHFRVS